MRLLRAFGLTALGFFGGIAAAAALAKQTLPSNGDAQSDEVALVAIFDGVTLESHARAFRGGSILAWFDGIAVDLRHATAAPDARLTVATLFGGVDIKVPQGWRVVSTARAFWGGVSDDVEVPEDPMAPTLTVTSNALFGGISIRAVAVDLVEA